MSEENTPNGFADMFAAVALSDEIAFAGVFAICRRLIAKGIFDDEDATYVTKKMRSFVVESGSAGRVLSERQLRTFDEMDMALKDAHDLFKADRPA